MIGIVISGHGRFATGLGSNIDLIAGEQESLILCDFSKGMSATELHQEFLNNIDKMKNLEGVVFFTDIPGGTPFNEAVKIKMTRENISVITGTNIPMLLDVLFNRELSLEDFVEKALDAGKNSIVQYEMKQRSEKSDDGI